MAWANHVLGQTHRWYFILACGKVLRVIFLNGRPVTSWSRSQKSIALSSCESEYLVAVGGGAEGIHIGRLWSFLVRKETEVSLATDSSSCRASAQRQGVGRLKHIETKYLWLQQCVKLGMLTMTGVATLLNVWDIGAKKLSKLRRSFLMLLMHGRGGLR
jgi:hypothetical protein